MSTQSKLAYPLIIGFLLSVNLPVVAVKSHCMAYYIGSFSKTTINKSIPSVGIRMKLPTNAVWSVRKDGSIEIMDKDTYNLISCLNRNHELLGTDNYDSTTIEKDNSHPDRVMPIKNRPGLYLARHPYREGLEVYLQIRTKKGNFKISPSQPGLAANDEELKSRIAELISIANTITVLR